LADLRDEDVVARQTAGLTSILSELVTGLKAGALVEIVEAAAQRYSEWWVVEALTLTIRRLETEEELQHVLNASNHLTNSDLRARIIGRTARRLVDLGFPQSAILAASSIELPGLRCDELVELTVRFASAGDGQSTRAAGASGPNLTFGTLWSGPKSVKTLVG